MRILQNKSAIQLLQGTPSLPHGLCRATEYKGRSGRREEGMHRVLRRASVCAVVFLGLMLI